ncbi:MAG TPA: ABC transporter ATP-binding protein/permease [Symbiobacteriaceae bacterium]|nr:ABC transporter ATP-binding protein/permease [Symbiobacteriaceae bacterium]
MIQLRQVNKTFNSGKQNEIKAISGTTLTFPEKGLVVLNGPSGSGKTTLLNVLGGLEYIDSGEIIFGDERISKRNASRLDSIRNRKIGYIFQQYNLLPNLTVFENIELVLKMQGTTDPEAIRQTIHYVLEAVGMFAFRKRKVMTLSGGQQQRVGIARAIAKNPDMIIADEPTGNLDSKNTLEIMNIIKKISRQKLVVLVTHERELADFYGDRIIEIRDGVVVRDYVNDDKQLLQVRHQNTIYLKDLERQMLLESPVKVDQYAPEGTPATGPVNVTLITMGNTLYVKVDGDPALKVRYVDEDSGMEFLDEHYKGLEQADVAENEFDFAKMALPARPPHSTGAAISTKEALRGAVKRLRSLSKLQKLLSMGFVFAAMIIGVAIALLGKLYHVNPAEFQEVDQHYVATNAKDVAALEREASVVAINPLHERQSFALRLHSFDQVKTDLPFAAHPSAVNLLPAEAVTIGRLPQTGQEVVIDKLLAEMMLGNDPYGQAGLKEPGDLVGLTLTSVAFGYQDALRVVGISDLQSPTVWMAESYLYEIAVNGNERNRTAPRLGTWRPERGLEVVPGGRLPERAGEVLYPEKFRLLKGYELGATMPVRVGAEGLGDTIVGFYTVANNEMNAVNEEVVMTTAPLLKETYFARERKDRPVLVYTNDVDGTVSLLESREFMAIPTYEQGREQFQADVRRGYYTLLVFAAVLLGLSLLQLYFMIRSSLLARIYDIGVYRSLGASRWDIHKMFVLEIAVLTTGTSMLGYVLITMIIKEIEKAVPPQMTLFYFPLPYIVGGVALIYAINILSGMLPVFRLTLKSPSQILKQHDA